MAAPARLPSTREYIFRNPTRTSHERIRRPALRANRIDMLFSDPLGDAGPRRPQFLRHPGPGRRPGGAARLPALLLVAPSRPHASFRRFYPRSRSRRRIQSSRSARQPRTGCQNRARGFKRSRLHAPFRGQLLTRSPSSRRIRSSNSAYSVTGRKDLRRGRLNLGWCTVALRLHCVSLC